MDVCGNKSRLLAHNLIRCPIEKFDQVFISVTAEFDVEMVVGRHCNLTLTSA